MNNLSDQISSPPQTSIIHQQSFQHKLPRHIAIVMDGNGRWAARRNLPRVAGHQAGAKAIRKIVEA